KKVIDITKQHEHCSATINCSWHVNFNNRKNSAQIVCTSLCNNHNHEMNSIVVQTALRFRKLTEEMLKDIEFYIQSAEDIGAKMQYNLLKMKYLRKYVDKKDLSNTIQRFRILSHDKIKTDAVETLQQLIMLKKKNPEWVVIPNINEENRLTALVLEQLNHATNQIIPKTVYTDADPAMGTALR
ncbi:3441_t:CDS:2, partial [Cetraspora pellucida]